MYDLNSIQYPAYIVVHGDSKHYISSHNRAEWDEHFAEGICYNVDQAKRMMDGYQGWQDHLKIIAVPLPNKIIRLYSDGSTSTEYEM